MLAGAVLGILALLATGCTASGPASASAGAASGETAGTVWLCRPGQGSDPCNSNLAVSAVTASGAVTKASWPHSTDPSTFACFYVHPTDSLATTANTGLTISTLDLDVAVQQAAPLSQVCDVWAPAYRSQTWTSVKKGLAGDQKVMDSTFTVAYDSVIPAWRWFLAHSGGRPIVLVGDSQGSAILIHLIATELDHEPAVLHRLLAAVLVGGNLQVPEGKTVGATFTGVPLCTSAAETGCAIAFSSYPSQPPADSVFGRPGQGTSLQSGQTATTGQQVACVNPAALDGGSGDLVPYVPKATQLGLTEKVSTRWITYPRLYSAQCEQGDGATWLQVASLAGKSRTRPVVNDHVLGDLGGTGPAWGYHGYEYGLTLGNLLTDIAGQEAAWQAQH
jgi:hypothetical protein